MKCKEVSHEMLVLMLQHVSSRVAGFFGAVALSMGEAANLSSLQVSKQAGGCSVVLRGRRGASCQSDMFHDVSSIVLCGRRNTVAMSFRRCVAVFVARAALWRPPM